MEPALQQLKDIHLPNAISMWPITPGWIALFLILITLSIYILWVWKQQRKAKYTVKFALAKLQNLKKRMDDNSKGNEIAAEISNLIRRTALYYYSREEVASLTGEAWISFLNRHSDSILFSYNAQKLLIEAPYQKSAVLDLIPLFTATQAWLKNISKNKKGEK